MAGVYWFVIQAAWAITKDWIGAASLVSKVLWTTVLFAGGIVMFALPSLIRGQGLASIITQIGWRVIEGLAGLAFAAMVLFLVSLFYYAPPIVLAHYEKQAANKAVQIQRQVDAKEFKSLQRQYADYRQKVNGTLDRIEQPYYKDRIAENIAKACDLREQMNYQHQNTRDNWQKFQREKAAKLKQIHDKCEGDPSPLVCEGRARDSLESTLGGDEIMLRQFFDNIPQEEQDAKARLVAPFDRLKEDLEPLRSP